MLRKLVVPSSKVDGVYSTIDCPDWLPYYAEGSLLVALIKIDGKETEVTGECIGLNITVGLDPGTRDVDVNIVYTLHLQGSGDIIEVIEQEIVASYEETNSLSDEYYEDE